MAVSVTFVPFENVPVSFVVLVFVVIPDGLELTLPDPLWLKLSVRGVCTKFTDAAWFDGIDTVHVVDVPAEAHAPPQPPICHPLEGLAVSVTLVPFENVPVSLVVLVFVVIPDGFELTLPEPFWLKLSVLGV